MGEPAQESYERPSVPDRFQRKGEFTGKERHTIVTLIVCELKDGD